MDFLNVTLKNQDGKDVSLKDFSGKYIVLYFYPKDDTPGCTIEAKEFSSLAKEFKKNNAVIVGVSPDNTASHKKFCDKYSLDIELLSDVDKKFISLFDVWKEKNMYGRKYMGVERSTFTISPEGNIIREYRSVSAPGHAKKVFEDLNFK